MPSPIGPWVRGRLLAPHPDRRGFTLREDALLRIGDGGQIVETRDAGPDAPVPETWPGAVILPGFVDAHLHFPQTRILGSASGPLLPWLRRSVFPEESRFAARAYAETVADEFCAAMLAQGTTLAGVYSSSHPVAAEALFEALDRRGLRAIAGLTLMNRGGPDALMLPTPQAMAATEALVERWHGRDGRLEVSVVPRFALSCDAEMMRAAGDLARRAGLWVQTHLSENREEIVATAAAHPGHGDYLGVYEAHGLVHSRTILAHCIYLSESEWVRVVESGASVAHCPDSNFFLGSGCMPLAAALERGASVALGTDIGAGRTFSMRRVAASAYDAALVLDAPVPSADLLWLATRGGALALGQGARLGCLDVGYAADLVAIDAPAGLGVDALIDALLFRHDAGPARSTVIGGRLCHGVA